MGDAEDGGREDHGLGSPDDRCEPRQERRSEPELLLCGIERTEGDGSGKSCGSPADVPEDLVRAFCLLGDPEAARARVREFHAAGADLPVIYPVATGQDHAASVVATLEALAPTT
jgi:alkanesulfonate monooxygenase SsuD/methylene tetrahydromethanopterin reductase-like flavin-dependent oxidoreductase (luciferase family)